ncbi:hypothetical protein HDU67_002979 [Dinochytrium kinnereticum]|nr:hypothetical protein HDU67_002979 [Dinochytrium kinnereticum]
MASCKVWKSRLRSNFDEHGSLAITDKYPSSLRGTIMTKDALDKRIDFINETAGKSMPPTYIHSVPLVLWFVGILSIFVPHFSSSNGCSGFDFDCKSVASSRFFISVGIMFGCVLGFAIVAAMMQCGLPSAVDNLNIALTHLNLIDNAFGFEWNYDVTITTTTTTTTRNGHTTSSTSKNYTYVIRDIVFDPEPYDLWIICISTKEPISLAVPSTHTSASLKDDAIRGVSVVRALIASGIWPSLESSSSRAYDDPLVLDGS